MSAKLVIDLVQGSPMIFISMRCSDDVVRLPARAYRIKRDTTGKCCKKCPGGAHRIFAALMSAEAVGYAGLF